MNNFFPFQIIRAIPFGDGLSFLKQEHRVNIKDKELAKIVWNILEFCDGEKNISMIAELSGINIDIVEQCINDLRTLGVVVDSRELFKCFHDVSNFPAPFNHKINFNEIERLKNSNRVQKKTGKVFDFHLDSTSNFSMLANKRKSTRAFSEEKLTLAQIGSICGNSYSLRRHVCPSGGGLYPLHLYVVITKEQIDLPVGYYEFDVNEDTLIRFSESVDIEQLKYCFNSSLIPFNSGVQIIIAGELKRQPKKYSNRGYRLTLIEVGHVAQNINLYCSEKGIGVCELGGMLDDPLKKELELDDDIYPILGLAVGYENSSREKITDSEKLKFVEDELINKTNLIQSSSTVHSKEFGSFFGATVSYGVNNQLAGATSPSYCDALFKASIEAYERSMTKNIPAVVRCSALELGKSFLDPRIISPLDREQLSRCKLSPFTRDLVIDWVNGKSASTGETIMVPRDLVVYGKEANISSTRVCWSSSSGVAAWTNADMARKKALLELIERDAIMRCWFYKKSPKKLLYDLYPVHVKKKQSKLQQKGFDLKLLALESDYGLVILATITSDKFPFFVCGASAGWKLANLDSVCLKAEQEAEYRLISELRRSDKNSLLKREEVLTPLDHGKYYCNKQHADELAWLTKNEEYAELSDPLFNYDALLSKLDVVWVDIPGPVETIKIARAFSSKLIPISFGYWNSYYSHKDLNVNRPDSPHFFA